jgi:CRP-like cAMP-binding protein
MIATDTHAALVQHPFLAGLDESHCELLASCGQMIGVPAGQHLFHAGQSADAFYLILCGRVAIEMEAGPSGHVCIQSIGPREVLGWSAFSQPQRWRFSARVIEPVRAVEMNGAAVRRMCDNKHDLGYELLKRVVNIMAERLMATRAQLLNHLE